MRSSTLTATGIASSSLSLPALLPSSYSCHISNMRLSSPKSSLAMLTKETKKELPPQQVISAVEKLGGQVTIPDVAATAGIPLQQSQQGLVNLAALTGATVQVSKDGDLLYKFPSGVRGVLLSRSMKQRMIQTWGKTWPVMLYITRVVFGIMLFASITAITLSITMLASASSRSSSDDDNGGGGGGFMPGPNFFFIHIGPSPFDFLRYDYAYSSPYRRSRYSTRTRAMTAEDEVRGSGYIDDRGPYYHDDIYEYEQERRMGILPAIFSYVFGDGIPRGLEKERLKMAAQMIRKSGGAVVADQLAPYLLDPKEMMSSNSDVDGSSSSRVDERDVLPILQALRGHPEVTESGTIVYVFPELQLSASGRCAARRERAPFPPSYFSEPTISFSQAAGGEKFTAGALCAANLALVLYLGSMLKKFNDLNILLPGFLGFMQQVEPVLLLYAVALNGIPLVRKVFISLRNRRIEARNDNRKRWALALRDHPETASRIQEAQQYSIKLKSADNMDVLYSTDNEIDDLLSENEIDDFDARLTGKVKGVGSNDVS